MTVLVTWASAHGSTREIADRLADRVASHGHEVERLPVDQVRDLGRYDAVVLGSALHDGAWLPEATDFVRAQRSALAQRPVWVFSVGMPGALPRWLRRWAWQEGPRAVAEVQQAVHPRGDHLFTGVVLPEHLPRRGRLLLRLMGGRFGDLRDWDDVRAWGEAVAGELDARVRAR